MKTFGIFVGVLFGSSIVSAVAFKHYFFQDWGWNPFWTSMLFLAIAISALLFGKKVDNFLFPPKK